MNYGEEKFFQKTDERSLGNSPTNSISLWAGLPTGHFSKPLWM